MIDTARKAGIATILADPMPGDLHAFLPAYVKGSLLITRRPKTHGRRRQPPAHMPVLLLASEDSGRTDLD